MLITRVEVRIKDWVEVKQLVKMKLSSNSLLLLARSALIMLLALLLITIKFC